jgi:hypothetical protein
LKLSGDIEMSEKYVNFEYAGGFLSAWCDDSSVEPSIDVIYNRTTSFGETEIRICTHSPIDEYYFKKHGFPFFDGEDHDEEFEKLLTECAIDEFGDYFRCLDEWTKNCTCMN